VNSKLIEAASEKVLRGLVLEILSQAEPTGATTELIQAALKPYAHTLTKDAVLSVCHYLKGKGLATTEGVSNDRLNISRVIVHITPKGVDVLEGTESVSGVELAGD